MTSMGIRFGTATGIVAPLEVERPQDAAPFDTLCALLFSLRVQVLALEEELATDRVIQRLRVCEFDGGPLSARRRRAIAEGVAAALGIQQEPLRPLARSPIDSREPKRAA